MAKTKFFKTIEYTVYEAVKVRMSQQFSEDGKVIPYTELMIVEDDFSGFNDDLLAKKILVVGYSKGKGFAGTVKRWGFRAGPKTHGQIKHRSPGSIGTQGQGRVIPGKKMAGRMGNKKINVFTNVVGYDNDKNILRVRGSVPGSRGQKVYIYLPKDES